MGVTRIRFLLQLWRSSSLDLPRTSLPEPKVRNPGGWTIPQPKPSTRGDAPRPDPPRPE